MLNTIKKSGWLVGGLIFFMPVLLIFFLASQMAYGQAKGQFDAYQNISEVASLAELTALTSGQVVMVRGQISESGAPRGTPAAPELVVYRERPADGREVRFREEFPLIFPDFVMDLPDGKLIVLASRTRDRVIQHELHAVAAGDRQYTGFRAGDTVTVQGEWQAISAGSRPVLSEVTGITGVNKIALITEWQSAFQQVRGVRNVLALLTLVSILLLVIQMRRARVNQQSPEEDETWQTPTTNTAPTV